VTPFDSSSAQRGSPSVRQPPGPAPGQGRPSRAGVPAPAHRTPSRPGSARAAGPGTLSAGRRAPNPRSCPRYTGSARLANPRHRRFPGTVMRSHRRPPGTASSAPPRRQHRHASGPHPVGTAIAAAPPHRGHRRLIGTADLDGTADPWTPQRRRPRHAAAIATPPLPQRTRAPPHRGTPVPRHTRAPASAPVPQCTRPSRHAPRGPLPWSP
jgi:hypothetical protein